VNANPAPLALRDPLAMEEARAAMREASRHIRDAETRHKTQIEVAADAATAYRKGLATAYVTRRAEGKGVGEAEVLSKGDAADLERTKAIAEGMVKACLEELEDRRGDRASLHKLVEWSMKVTPTGEQEQGSGEAQIFGGRRAA
jgi:hypothetical protein